MLTFQTLWKLVFWFGVIAVCGVSLVPQQDLPQTGILDKWQHVAAYFVLMTASYPAYSPSRRRSEIGIGIGLCFLGAALEVAQSYFPDRVMSMADAFANTAGILLAILAFRIVTKLLHRFETADA